MICISVMPESRRLAKVDLLNASRRCDLIELRLDRLIKTPDFKEMFEGIDKPILVSCRRAEEGGHWKGTEDARVTLLRQAIVAEPAYVELEVDIASSIPRFGKTKRVISYTDLKAPLNDVGEIIGNARDAQADVIKLTGLTKSLESAWPLLVTVTGENEIPIVGVGVGQANTTFTLLGLRYGSPWVYTALEVGMETYEGQQNVFELDETYHWNEINSKTRFVGIVGTGQFRRLVCRGFNAGFAEAGLNLRCLPLDVESIDKLKKILDILKISAVSVEPFYAERLISLAEQVEDSARLGNFADFLLNQKDGWHGYNSYMRAVLRSVESQLAPDADRESAWSKRNVLVFGHNHMAESLICYLKQHALRLSITSPLEQPAMQMAQELDVRYVPYVNVYDTLADVVLFCDKRLKAGHEKTQLNPSYIRPEMVVADLANFPEESELITEAREREARLAEPREILIRQIQRQFLSITGRELSRETIEDAWEA